MKLKGSAGRVVVVGVCLSIGATYLVVAGRRESPKVMASSKLRQIAIAALLYANLPATQPALAGNRPTTTPATQPATQPTVTPLAAEKR